MTYKTKKIFDPNTLRNNDVVSNNDYCVVWESICIVNGELHCQGNDSYMPWQINSDEKFGSGAGYITENESKAISQWLLSEGGEPDENVLIWVSW